MRIALIGHRGVGKSSLLARIERYYRSQSRPVLCLDLDHEIGRDTGRSCADIFAFEGEDSFRKQEIETFRHLDRSTVSEPRDVFISLGAGFDPERIPESWHVIWVRRPSDHDGRIFFDRPRLNRRVSALEEFSERFQARQDRYRNRANETVWIDEGIENEDAIERSFFLREFHDLSGCITVLAENCRNIDSFSFWLRSRMAWGVRWFELRDDLLSEEQIEFASGVIGSERSLVSFRNPARVDSTLKLVNARRLRFDWALELGGCRLDNPFILSMHGRVPGESLEDALAKFPIGASAIMKAAVPVDSFSELLRGNSWQQAEPGTRVFLPVSRDRRWTWYRLLKGTDMILNFFRESDGSAGDQPTLLQWARQREREREPRYAEIKRFAAVLGDPVNHSRTPIEQSAFFARKNAPVFAIRMTVDEWREGALESLRSLGLRWAAITAPLKTEAFGSCAIRDAVADELGAVNTMQWDEVQGVWKGANTDLVGFQTLLADEEFKRPAVWGGGGTLKMISSALPKAQFFSLRSGQNRDAHGTPAEQFDPDAVFWAAGRLKDGIVHQPPEEWRPKTVIDLNYTQDSPAREFALHRKAKYVSGLEMFRVQAKAQREFWELK